MSTATHETGTIERTRPTLRSVPDVASYDDPRGASARQLEQLWDRHGSSICSLASVLVDDADTASQVVTLAMIDLALTTDDITGPDAHRALARRVYLRSRELAPAAPAADLPAAMVWLADLAPLQRACLALCCFGDHTHRQAAELLEVPADTVAELLTAGLRDVAGSAAVPADCA